MLNFRFKIISERNFKTGNSRQTWRYYDEMSELLHGDPAVSPIAVASSIQSPMSSSSSIRTTPTSSPQKKKPKLQRMLKEPSWVKSFKEDLHKMHEDRVDIEKKRLELEERRVCALEKLVDFANK
jgi:hypothetical protein